MLFDTAKTLAPGSPSLPTSVGVAIFSGYCLDLLKRLKQVPDITYYSRKFNLILRIIMSGAGTLGISWAWSAAGEGHQLLITIPAWSAIAIGLWHWTVQYGMQHSFEGVLQVQRQLDVLPTIPEKKVNES